MIKLRLQGVAACLAFFVTTALADIDHGEREVPGWRSIFEKYDTDGTIVIRDERGANDQTFVYNKERSTIRYTPASTFKLPHTLFALDSGAVKNEFQVFKWSGENHEIPSHNQDQNLRSAMRYSALWAYREYAKEIGELKASRYLKKIKYGNQSTAIKSRDYWVNGGLAVSAEEQIAFLQKLYRNELPFKLEHQILTKDIMVTEAGRDWVVRSKTGLGQEIGWWVGWIELPSGPVFFAVNIDTPNRMADAHKREAIGREILKTIGAFPTI